MSLCQIQSQLVKPLCCFHDSLMWKMAAIRHIECMKFGNFYGQTHDMPFLHNRAKFRTLVKLLLRYGNLASYRVFKTADVCHIGCIFGAPMYSTWWSVSLYKIGLLLMQYLL